MVTVRKTRIFYTMELAALITFASLISNVIRAATCLVQAANNAVAENNPEIFYNALERAPLDSIVFFLIK